MKRKPFFAILASLLTTVFGASAAFATPDEWPPGYYYAAFCMEAQQCNVQLAMAYCLSENTGPGDLVDINCDANADWCGTAENPGDWVTCTYFYN